MCTKIGLGNSFPKLCESQTRSLQVTNSSLTEIVRVLKPLPHLKLSFQTVCLALALVVGGGCSTSATSTDRLTAVHAGMTKQQVMSILGKPYGSELRDGVDILIYDLATDRARAAMYGGMLRSLNLGKQFYRFEFVGDHLRSYYTIEKP